MSLRACLPPRFALLTATMAVLAAIFLIASAQADSEVEPCAGFEALTACARADDSR